MAVVLGNADLLESEAKDHPGIRRRTSSIRAAVKRGADLTQQLLSFACDQIVTPSPIDLRDLIPRIAALLRGNLPDSVVISFVQPEKPIGITADVFQLEKAMIALAQNAREAMPGGGTVRLSGFMTPPLHNWAGGGPSQHYGIVALEDSGAGMPPYVQAQALDPFFTTREQVGHLGLGLSRVDQFMKQSAGFMEFESQEGRGTTVRLHFPLTGHPGDHEGRVP